MEHKRGKPIKQKVKADVKRQRSDSKRQQQARQAEFNERLRLTIWEPTNEASMTKFRKISKSLIQSGQLTLSELAVYPVLCNDTTHEHEEWYQISMANIARQTGLGISAVRRAVDRLLTHLAPDGTKLLQRQEKTEGKITFYRYHAWYVPEMDTETEYFFFYMYIVESGVWRKLDRRAKALYLVLRANARFNFMRYCDVEGLDYSTFQKSGNLAHKWEECLVSVAELCRQVGMSNSHIHDAIRQLNRSGLIYYVVGRGFMVYQLPEVTPVDIEV